MSDIVDADESSAASGRFSIATNAVSGGAATVAVTGDVDLLTAPQMDAAVQGAQCRTDAVLLDLSDVRFLGSAGLSVLVDAARRAGDTNARLAILVTQRPVIRAIEVTGLDAVLQLFDTPGAAAEYLND